MPTKRCSWGRCNSDSRYSDREHMQGVQFFPFPKPWIDAESCRKWLRACGRPYEQLNEKKIAGHHYVCSKHFLLGNPTQDYPYPVAADPLFGNRAERCRPAPKKRAYVIKNEACKKRKLDAKVTGPESGPEHDHEPAEQKELDQPASTHEEEPTEPVKPDLEENNAHFDIQCENCGHKLRLNLKQKKRLRREGFIQMIQESDAACFQYTGVPSETLLKRVFDWLKPAAEKVKLWDGKKKQYTTGKSGARKRKALTLFEEFVLTLVRIRRGYDVVLLSYLFGITTSQVGRVVPAWVNFLAKCLKPLIKWPSRKNVQENLPKSFAGFPRTRVIIDCTEIFVEKAFRPSAQRATWSNYKHSNTFKLLVGIMPSGAITFVSKLYSGSISDQKIVEKSGIIDKLENGDDVMADRGFNIRHLVLPKGATLNIPSFTYGKRLSTKAIKRSRRIARVRIHVERAIRRMKTFRILSGVIPIRLRFQLNQIITIVTVLCNLQDRLA